MNLFSGRKRDADVESRHGAQGEGMGGVDGEGSTNICTATSKLSSCWEAAV